MVRAALEEAKEICKARLLHFKGKSEDIGQEARSVIIENNNCSSDSSILASGDERATSKSEASIPLHDQPVEIQRVGCVLNRNGTIKSRLANESSVVSSPRPKQTQPSDTEMMKEKFAKLLLGEDMSGGGKGVSSALALSNAITNLAASAFGEQKRLEPMPADRKTKWRKEIDWLLSVTDHIVEFVPSKQISKDGTSCMEVMVTKQRTDLQMNIPALRKLDAMLLDCLDSFKDQNEFSYVSKDDDSQEGRNDDKWWIPTPKVPPNGLSDVTRKWLQFQKDSVNQVLKAAMAINAQVLLEMEIPESYIDSLPKNGRASLGDGIYRSITDEYFDPDYFLTMMDLTSEHKILDLKNKLEASVIIWRRKMTAKDGKSAWGSAVSVEKREIFEDRAETILLILKQRFPGIPQSSLDISKIQYNEDVGQAILESYSRIIESRAHTVMSRIEDVLQADAMAQNPSSAEVKRSPLLRDSLRVSPSGRFPNAKEEIEKLNSVENPTSMTLLDFMGWTVEQGENDTKKDLKEDINIDAKKPPNIVTNKKLSYLENLVGSRSPTARH
ncbi:rop guanine nucleotide exchange factor 12-like [Lycium ferocissimum]|uniref:rop guanine nucleotide exchange factor 12-like n=1 Tax=Lycium ferocissimum TaxID=112874 RepID=UPI002815B61D|nr:rop guanine nucleotide exchange factor 12-like [Lycium ferocissimum]